MAEVSVKLRISVKTPATITSPVSWFRIDMLVGVELFTLHVSPNGDVSLISCLWYAWNTVMLGISEINSWQICIQIKLSTRKYVVFAIMEYLYFLSYFLLYTYTCKSFKNVQWHETVLSLFVPTLTLEPLFQLHKHNQNFYLNAKLMFMITRNIYNRNKNNS